ncbi:lipopolysaccharide biosynthesis protein [Arhodomonas aquaeolei]|uniref:lipopolysaccharide biosynthesis protein n=1 Tax=Arhodomonas aquaeolei TaxID=2369 RepID=UPI0021680B69|nr:lipopolysaccharide biosynthesis protein [Arhodomonas aquaeolei]MCS4503119.1 lipopolysaccharide biosynthesis protein [Arhodomonas aquaeolei]
MAGGQRHAGADATISKGALRRVLANSGKLLGGKTVSAVLGLITIALAVRALGIEGYGTLALVHTFTLVIGRVVNFKSWQAILRYGTPLLHDGDRPGLRRLIRFTALLDVASAAAAALVCATLAWSAGTLVGWPAAVTPMAALYGFSALFMVSATPLGVLRLFDRFDLLAVRSPVQSGVRLVGVGLAIALDWGIAGFLAVWFLARVLTTLSLIVCACGELARQGLLAGPADSWRGLRGRFPGILRFIGITSANAVLALGVEHMGTLAVGVLLGADAVGLFHVADRLARALSKPVKLLTPAIYPEIAGLLAAGETRRLRRLVLRTVAICGVLVLAVMAVLALAGDPLLGLMGGAPAREAYGVMLLLAFSVLLPVWWFPLGPLLISAGHPGRALLSQGVGTLVYLAAVAPLVHVMGVEGAGLAAAVSALARLLVRLAAALPWLRTAGSRGGGDNDGRVPLDGG